MTNRSLHPVLRAIMCLTVAAFAASASAELPAPTDDAKAKAAEAAAKGAWADKVSLYQTCLSMDRTAEIYRAHLKATGKEAPAPVPTAPCTDPGPYVSHVVQSAPRPLEASGAHSPPEVATSPPSANIPAADLAPDGKTPR